MSIVLAILGVVCILVALLLILTFSNSPDTRDAEDGEL